MAAYCAALPLGLQPATTSEIYGSTVNALVVAPFRFV